ncbi:MAG: Crp/Fnr family transcriptional regulator [Phenylobacterium sp.]|nr:Crp/Fnr family transcriptional regulator [Phenylobacterium sp.]MDB5494671.1 Crp/Fnr family transcriptional regulator [Phenylobacterium sp.]
MSAPSQSLAEHDRLIAKLESIGTLTLEERAAIKALPLRVRQIAEDTDIVRDGDTPTESCLLVEGFLCRYKMLPDGGRQILAIHTAGDIPDLQSLQLKVMDHSLGSLTPCKVAFISHAALHDITRAHPGVMALFWRDTLIDAAIFREWLTGVGRRSAHQRIAHLICEIHLRLKVVGLTDDDGFELPITQAELADALGLSTVHVNRVLQDLRRDGLIASRGKFLAVTDWRRLEQAGGFDPRYLHVR